MITPANFQAFATRAAKVASSATFTPAIVLDGNTIGASTSEAHYLATIDEPFPFPATSVPPVELLKALAAVGGEADLSISGSRLSIRGNGASVNIPTIEGELAQMREDTNGTVIDVDLADLNGIIGAVAYALPAKDHRRVLMGVCLSISDMTIQATATDGKKLAVARLPLNEVNGPDGAWIIPPALIEAMEGMKGNARIVLTEHSATIEAGPERCPSPTSRASIPTSGRLSPRVASAIRSRLAPLLG
jgi:hypothetical protein